MSEDKRQAADAVPSAIGRYQITGTLGFGAMGAVYKAFDPLIKRTLAIKTIRLDIPRQSPQHRAFIERFYQEARISGTLSHPSIVTLFDIGEEAGVPFLAMEFIDGRTIASIIEEGTRFKPERVVGLVSQVAAALDYAHSRGVVHRDIKPSNLIVYDGDKIKVTDFSIAKLADAEITHSGALLGTPSYMSPEQAMGEKLDGRSDIFSLGVVAFEMLSGQQPFPGANVTSILYKLVHVDPVEPADLETNGLVPQKWREVFHKVLAKKPADRYPTASAFVQDLEYCLGSWFTGLGEETVALQAPVPDESTVTIPRMEAPAVTVALPAGPPAAAGAARPGTPVGAAGAVPATGAEEEGAATLVFEAKAPAPGDARTVERPVAASVEDLVPAPTVALAALPTEASKTQPPMMSVPELAAASIPAAAPRPARRGLSVAAVLSVAAAVVVLGSALVGWAVWQRVRAASPATEDVKVATVPPTTLPTTGSLRVESEPRGARVRVNGEARGRTPLELSGLPFGVYEVRVEETGYDPQRRDVSLNAGSAAAELRVSLARAVPVSGTADVVSSPSGASVRVDGRPAGTTPLAGVRLKPGARRIQVALEGYETWTGSIDAVAGRAGRVEVRLRPLPPTPAPPIHEAPPTPAPVDTGRVYANVAGEVDTLAKRTSGFSPSYPADRAPRLRSGERVSVTVRFVVTEGGEVEDVAVVESGGRVVDDVVVSAIKTWKFQPAAKRGTPVKVLVTFKQTFLGG